MKTWLIFIYLAPTLLTILLVQNEGVDGREEESGIPSQNSSQAGPGGQGKNDSSQQERLNNPKEEAIPENEETANRKAESNPTRREEQIESVSLKFLNATEASLGGTVPAKPTIVPTTIQKTNSSQRCQPNPWASCSEATEEDKTQLAEALTEFAINFYRAAIKLEKSDSNLVFSPFSISMLLSSLLLGSRGETKKDFAHLLSYPEEFTCIHDAMSTFRKSEALTAASAIFTQPAISLNEDFSLLSQKFYHSKIQKLTNDSDKDVNEINDYVRKNTAYKIKKILDQLDSDVQMVLLNAVYFRSKWKTIFKTKHTLEENFYRPGLPPSKVLMMSSKKYPLASFSDHSLQAKVGRLQLSQNMSLVVIVPRSLAQNLSDVENRLSGDVFKSIMAKLGHISFKPTVVTIPKFKVDSSLDLLSVVAEMAYGILFDANLCGIAENEELAVSSARHRAVMEINEEGVEAAAATAVSLARTANFFEVQQPFIFAVVNERNFPIFMGRINNPKA